ncbi:uncharacterized protein LOC143649918 [Tamandua tetradactyla]|uniref:uncharacterized protein LOC143649918 n=1 Tax=Tamandua tetradactyla TaxID=48850 RepID=UPI0040549046
MEEPVYGYQGLELGTPRGQGGWAARGRETGHVSPSLARHVSPTPSLPLSALGTGSDRSSWLVGPGLARGSQVSSGGGEGQGTPLPLDTSRFGSRRQAGAEDAGARAEKRAPNAIRVQAKGLATQVKLLVRQPWLSKTKNRLRFWVRTAYITLIIIMVS